MKSEKIYSLFLKEIENQERKTSSKRKGFRVIISFENISKRDKYISKYKKIEILNKFDLIPSLITYLDREQILKYEKEDLITKIEEDQRLFLSILDINKILNLNRCKNSQIPRTGRNVSIGIIDDGINNNFMSIAPVSKKNVNSREFKKSAGSEITHGTIMASIIGNQIKESSNIPIGIAPDVKLFDFDISNSKSEYFFSNILQIFDNITKENIEIDILLISLTSKHPSDGMDILSQACDILVDRGILIVCPAGNYGPKETSIGSPSAAKKVISFGSLTKELTITRHSGRGPTIDNRIKPDFCLPGSKIKIPLSNELQVKVTGTSVAAAIGAGLVALLKEFKPDASHSEIFNLLKNSSRNLELDKFSQGYGMPNIITIFEDLNLIPERIIPYNYLIRHSIKIAIEIIFVLIIIFYLFYFFRIT
ncbi:MAG: S8 family serine peptidase [Candidatus Hodarchaeota archaeon]